MFILSLLVDFYNRYSTSGSPVATDVAMDKIPLNIDADATIFQSTEPINVAVPIVAIKVCATVFIALIPAAFNHSLLTFFLSFRWQIHQLVMYFCNNSIATKGMILVVLVLCCILDIQRAIP